VWSVCVCVDHRPAEIAEPIEMSRGDNTCAQGTVYLMAVHMGTIWQIGLNDQKHQQSCAVTTVTVATDFCSVMEGTALVSWCKHLGAHFIKCPAVMKTREPSSG